MGIGAFLSPNDIEPAASVLACINDDLGRCVSLVLEDAKSSFGLLANNSKLIVLRDDFKLLVDSVFVFGDNKLVLFGDSEYQSFIKD